MIHRASLTAALAVAASACGGCVSHQFIETSATPAVAAREDLPQELLLDVGIVPFDPAIPEDPADQAKDLIVPGVRKAEARYMPYQLRETMEDTGNWGAVRVLPRPSLSTDITVAGRIILSDGESLSVAVSAVDSTGRIWLDEREYSDTAGKLSYRDELNRGEDPFQDLYNDIADDLLEVRNSLGDDTLRRVRTVSELQFAADLSPGAFGDYLRETEDGRYEISRLPARDDPMLERVRKVRERDYLFADTVDQYFGEFHSQMGGSYDEWRRFNYDEVSRLRQLQRDIRMRTVMGAVAIAGGIAADAGSDSAYGSYAGRTAALVGLSTILSTMRMRPEVQVHLETLREMGDSFDASVRPAVLEVEGKTITLSGTADAQYEQWRGLLRDIYEAETGLPEIVQDEAVGEEGSAAAEEGTTAAR